jgi:hypothetical protein
MLGLKSFRTAAIVMDGIELAEKIKKGQFKIGKLAGSTATIPELWQPPWLSSWNQPSDTARPTRFGSTLRFAPEPP